VSIGFSNGFLNPFFEEAFEQRSEDESASSDAYDIHGPHRNRQESSHGEQSNVFKAVDDSNYTADPKQASQGSYSFSRTLRLTPPRKPINPPINAVSTSTAPIL